tara:strand:+ start:9381 stop:10163 length:783 start_codon:yes stop_codon:yes gene_type:complete
MLNYLKVIIQKLIRLFHIVFFKKDFPKKIIIYFHETEDIHVKEIQNIILFFKFSGYEFVTTSEMSRQLNFDTKLIALTFDDAFENWSNILPVFEQYDIKATFFINSIAFTGEKKENYFLNINKDTNTELLTIKTLKNMSAKGHEIGGHTHSHPTLSKVGETEFENEIKKNIDILSSHNLNLNSFAVPFGMKRYVNKNQVEFLLTKFNTICFGEPGLLHHSDTVKLQRTPWIIEKSFKYNLNNICTDTRLFNFITKRSGLG